MRKKGKQMKRKRKSYFTKDLLIEFRGCFNQNKNTKSINGEGGERGRWGEKSEKMDTILHNDKYKASNIS